MRTRSNSRGLGRRLSFCKEANRTFKACACLMIDKAPAPAFILSCSRFRISKAFCGAKVTLQAGVFNQTSHLSGTTGHTYRGVSRMSRLNGDATRDMSRQCPGPVPCPVSRVPVRLKQAGQRENVVFNCQPTQLNQFCRCSIERLALRFLVFCCAA